MKRSAPGTTTQQALPGLCMFGSPGFDTSGAREPLPAERPYQLLAYLACRGGWVSREVVATLFWPERELSTSRANLRFVLVQIKRLERVHSVETRTDSLRWTIDNDVRRFESALADRRWPDAIDTYAGPLLEGFERGAPAPFAEWLQFERMRLHAQWHDALAARLAQQVSDEPEACAALAARALRTDALDEMALGFRLRALAGLGRGDEARRDYRDYAARLATELGVEPSAALRELARQIAQPRTATQRTVVAQPASPGEPGFVGRRVELARIRELLAGGDCRLLTITGLGGVGKSALARAALRGLAGEFPAGAVWIALDDLHSLDQVAQRCLAAFGVELRGSDPALQQLVERLRAAVVLLVLDNAEHLGGLDRWVDELLWACGGIRLLITSRGRVGAAEEWLLPLEGLPVPDADETEPDVLRAYDSVRLFEVRARAQQPAYDAAAGAADAAALARAMEGLPLALELAATRVRLLPLAEIARDLAESIDIIEPASDDPARRHSLRASFEHSWRLLAPRERHALAACTVFDGTFSREAAHAIGDAPLALLASLVDKSLVRADGSGRFSLHALIRQCAAHYVDDAALLRRQHAEYFTRVLERHAEFRQTDHRRVIAEVELELTHCRAAWKQALADRSATWIDRMAPALRHFFEATGRWSEGVELLSAALAVLDAHDTAGQATRVKVCNALAALLWRRADFAAAELRATEALAMARAAGERRGIKAALNLIGMSLWQMGRYDEARGYYEEALSHAHADGDREGVSKFNSNLAIIEKIQGHYTRAAELYEEALAIERESGDQRGLVTRLNNLGNLHRARRDWTAAMRCFEEGLQLAQTCGLAAPAVFLLVNLALTTLELGQLERCEHFARQGLEQARTHGEPLIGIMALLALARLATRRGDHRQADEHTLQALVRAQGKTYILCELAALHVRAEALAARGQRLQAATLWRIVMRHPLCDAMELADAEDGVARLGLNVSEDETTRTAGENTSFEALVDATVAQLSSC